MDERIVTSYSLRLFIITSVAGFGAGDEFETEIEIELRGERSFFGDHGGHVATIGNIRLSTHNEWLHEDSFPINKKCLSLNWGEHQGCLFYLTRKTVLVNQIFSLFWQ